MAKIIVTSRFIRNSPKQNAGNLVKYMGTREGVERVRSPEKPAPATVRQQRLIKDLLKADADAKNYLEYRDYENDPSKQNATEFIDAFIERNADRINEVDKLVKYMAERPGVEKLGPHGLFGQLDDRIDLDSVAEEVGNHTGPVWTYVVSLRREDAERLGYNNAQAWRDLVRRNVTELAKAHNIAPDQLQWYGAYHDKSHHPHMHLVVYSKDPSQGWLTKKGIDELHSFFGNDIFRFEQQKLFRMETELRNKLKDETGFELLKRVAEAEKTCKLTQGDLQQFYAELKRNGRVTRREQNGPGLSDRMVRSCHATCRMALEKAKAEGLILSNPAAGCKLPPKKKKEMQVLTGEEMQRFLIQAKEDGFYEMMLLELATGMRRGEICALKWDDLNVRTGELQIQRQVIHVAGELRESSPKTKNSERVVILPPGVVKVLKELRDRTNSRWMFPSPVKEDAPLDPQSAYRKMKKALQRAGCKNLRFHDLRHTFATMALEHGMDVKTLSAVIGHVSSTTTLDVYSHITGAMQLQAAQNIERVIGHSEAYEPHETLEDRLPTDEEMEATRPKFSPYTGKIRKPGTGGLYELNDHLYEGRYSPTNAQGKREVHTVYAKTREEAEALLKEMIREVRVRIDAEKAALKAKQTEQQETEKGKG